MYLTDEQIIELLIEYITDERYMQAVLIDGDWGSGKTYFIREKLIKELQKTVLEKTKQYQSILYISLYGMENVSQIVDEINITALEHFFDKKLGDGRGEKISKSLNITSKLLATGMKYFNLDQKDLPKISDLKKIENAIIIFDDMERCSVDVIELLGFINNLVEHSAIKVVIVANESEMVNIGKCSNDSKNTDVTSEISKSKADQVQDQLEQMSNNVNINYYHRIKEKVIGFTIRYQSDLSNVFEEVIQKYIKEYDLQKKLLENKELVLSVFNKANNNNIRTFIFALVSYEKIYKLISEIHFEPEEYIEVQYQKTLTYTLKIAILLKSGKSISLWNDTTAETGNIYLDKDGIWGDATFGYRFIDEYLKTRFLDSEKVKTIIKETMEEEKKQYEDKKIQKSLSYNKLQRWMYLEDKEIEPLINSTLEELNELKYTPLYFKHIIITLMQLKHANFDFDFQELFDKFIVQMMRYMKENKPDFNMEHFKLLNDDKEIVDEYNLIMNPLFNMLFEEDSNEKEKVNLFFEINTVLDSDFVTIC